MACGGGAVTPLVIPAGAVCACEQNMWQRHRGERGELVRCAGCGFIAAIADDDPESPALFTVTLTLCSLCLLGEGGQCHVPGCAMWMKSAADCPLYLDACGGIR